MTTTVKLTTLEEFLAFALLPENQDKDFEFINGEVIDVSPARTSNSWLSNLLVFAVISYCRDHQIPVFTTSGDGTYLIDGRVIVPDFAYKRTPMSDDNLDPVPPLLAVEVISPTDEPTPIRNKRLVYQQAGILYWEIYPKEKSIDIYEPGKPSRTVGIEDALDGGDVIPGFVLPLKELFAE
jgi:Uma2 family endonuclease